MTEQHTLVLEPPTKRDMALIRIAECRRQLGIDRPIDDLYRPDDPEAA